MMRTKAMREKEEQRERRKYNYTLLRIRLPDGSLLQGNHTEEHLAPSCKSGTTTGANSS